MENKIYKYKLIVIITASLLLSAAKVNATTNSQENAALKLFLNDYKETIENCARANEIGKMETVIFEMTTNNPQTLKYAYKYFVYSFARFSDVSAEDNTNLTQLINKLQKSIDCYEKSEASESPGIECLKLKITEKNGGDTFNASKEFAKKYPQFEFIAYVIGIMRDSIKPEKPEQIEKYYQTLQFLAGKQKKQNTEIIQFLLDEKQKVEMIIPEVNEN